MDRGIWAVWYDLPEEGEDEYISWLHEAHIPQALARPGYLWAAHVKNVVTPEREERIRGAVHHTDDASVPTGVQYLMLYGALGPTVFLDPSPEQMAEKMTEEAREMLDMRKNARSCVFMEHNRVDGPEVKTRAPGIAPGPGIQFGTFNINAVENEDELGCWYSQVRMPRLTSMEGCVGARNLVSVSGWAKHGILYEWVSLESLEKNFVTEKIHRSRQAVSTLVHAPSSPSVGERIWPPAGDC